jgi:hypothetical protein
MPEVNTETITDQIPEGPYPKKLRTPEEKSELFIQAFDLFMHDPRQPTIVTIARELRMEPAALLRYAQNKGWEQMRLQQKSIVSTVQNEKRLNTAKKVDERIVESADLAITKASAVYLEVINRIADLPIDPKDVPEDELTKDDHGNVKSYPKRAKLLEEKVFLMNQAMDGFMKMAQGAQGIGLVLNNKTLNTQSTSEDLNKLTKLNVLLLNIQNGKAEKEVKAMEV